MKSHSSHSNSNPYGLNKKQKQNLRIINVNAQSIRGKTSEFATMISYCKPDIVCCTESWLAGKKPGENLTTKAILDSEIFPGGYKSFRNDRGMHGGGVFILVKDDLVCVEQPSLVTDCEIDWVKIHLQGRKELNIGVFYMPHRNLKDLNNLDTSIEKLNTTGDKQFILCGDFNCPGIDWTNLTIDKNSPDKDIQQHLIDISNKFGLTQVIKEATRDKNILDLTLDLTFVTNPSLVKNYQII